MYIYRNLAYTHIYSYMNIYVYMYTFMCMMIPICIHTCIYLFVYIGICVFDHTRRTIASVQTQNSNPNWDKKNCFSFCEKCCLSQ
uniref:Uncharacterized protein n=1 Tax=Nothoprocta perdicaria TaxID=30464 RepID=A0A8C7E953_NOTPE